MSRLLRIVSSRERLSIPRFPEHLRGWAALLLLLLTAASAPAQVTSAEILGTVTDPSGAVIPNIKVTAQSLTTSTEYSIQSDNNGNYLIRLLPPGSYSLRVEVPGFKTWTVREVAVAIGDRLRQDVQLETGQLSQTVEVTAETPALQSESATLGGLIGERAVANLPLNGRNFIALTQLVAGANDAAPVDRGVDDRRRSSGVAVNGQSSTFNNFLIDGMDNNERFIGSVIVRPSIDALAEVRVQTSQYSAELGRTAGGVINMITKAGGNEFHGTLFHFFRNEKLDARNLFARPQDPKPAYKQNQFGGSLGGPIVRNRTFFFTDYESFRLRQATTITRTVPTAAMRLGNFAGVNPIFDPLSQVPDPARPGFFTRSRFQNDQIPLSRMDPVALNVLSLYPLPQTSALANNLVLNPVVHQNDEIFDIRVDHMFSSADNIFGRYSINDTSTLLPAASAGGGSFGLGSGLPKVTSGIGAGIEPGGVQDASQRAQSAQVNEIHIFNPRTTMELKANFSRFVTRSLSPNSGTNASQQIGLTGANTDLDSSGLANFTLGTYAAIGDGSFLPTTTINNLYQAGGTISYAVAQHSVKFGGDVRRRHVNQAQSQQPVGLFTFDSNFTNDPSGATARSGNEIASLLLGYPASVLRSKYLIRPGYRLIETGAFVQDDWRVTRWLTLNLGLRYEYFSPISEVANRVSNADLDRGKIIIAGQDGISNTVGVEKDFLNLAPRFGFAALISNSTVLRGGYGINYMPQSFGTPYALRNPPFSSLLTTTTSPTTPVQTVRKLSEGLPPPTPTDPANPTGSLNAVAFNMVAPYLHQYNLTLQQEVGGKMVATASYVGVLGRKGNSVSNGAGGPNINLPFPAAGPVDPRRPYFSKFPNVANISLLENWINSSYQALQLTLERRFQRGLGILSTYTWSHAIDNAEYRLLAPGVPEQVRGSSGQGSGALDIRHRFTLALNYDLPFSNTKGFVGALVRGWRVNTITVLQTGTPLTIANQTPRSNTGGPDRPNVLADPRLPSDERTLARWFDTSVFVPQAINTWGNAGRSILNGPGRISVDLSLHREFNFTERIRLQFRAEAFNISNTPPLGNPNTNLGNPAFGSITSAGLPRNIQLALKLLF